MKKMEIKILSSLATSYAGCEDRVLKDFYLTAIKDVLILLNISSSLERYEELVSEEKAAALSPNERALEKEIENIFGHTLEEHKFRILAGHLNDYINAKNSDVKELEKNVVKDMIKILSNSFLYTTPRSH